MTGKPLSASPSTLRAAILTGLIRVVGEQRYADRVEELDRMADGVLAEVKRHQCATAHIRTRGLAFGTDALRSQLLHLADRAADGRLLPGEARLLREGIRKLAREARDGA